MIQEMTSEEQIGQLFVVGFHGLTPSSEVADLIRNHHVGGIILFSRNVRNAGQLLALTSELQEIAREAGHRYPLLISIDQENGVVRRLRQGTTIFPGNMGLGAAGSERLAREIALATGRELHALGVNMNLAPVVDVNNNPANPVIGVRSFGEDPARVARLATAAVEGYREAGVISCLKHFPGHGDTATDSHVGLPVVSHSLERLEQVELLPFGVGIDAGADSVMVAHLYVPELMGEEMLPSSASSHIIRGLLRERMGFEGVVVSDDMEMGAILESVGTERAVVKALAAGTDLVFVSHLYERQQGSITAVRAALEGGGVSRELIAHAVERVVRLKARYLSWDGLPGRSVPDWVGGGEHHALARRAYESAVTLVRDDARRIPLRLGAGERVLVLYPRHESLTFAEEENRYPRGFVVESIAKRHAAVEGMPVSASPTEEEREQVSRKAVGASAVVMCTMNANLYPGQAELMRLLLRSGRSVIGIAVRNPYDLMAFPELGTYLATYEYTPPALEVAVRVLFGEIQPHGRLPVSLPGLYAPGAGIEGLK
ncbi:MAG: beta-N-acetylhexosaminidase [Chloroflexota bacterium]|nr:beta-N-acetylhexosaminidase [Chloroflexota bacterium]